jgi:hypothetical protein
VNCPPRYTTVPDPSRTNQLKLSRKIAKLLGIQLMEHQEHVLALFSEQDENGKYVYTDSTLVMPRRNGKTTLLLVLVLTQALRYPGSHIWMSAQDLKSARACLIESWWPLIANSPLAGMFTLRKSSGSEQLQCGNGSVVHLLTATSKLAGHGATCDLYLGDEYFAMQDTRLEAAMLPAQATRASFGGGARSIFCSTPGTPATSQPLLQRTERGRQLVASGSQTGIAYSEWSAPDDADPSDPAVWAAANPAYGITISEDAVRSEYESMELVDYRRQRLAQWTTTVNDPVIDAAMWLSLIDMDSKRGKSLAMSFDSSPAGEWSSISFVSIRDDGKFHTAVMAHREGTGWLAEEVHRLYVAYRPNVIIYDPRSPAANAVPELTSKGVPVDELSGADQTAAFAAFVAACNDDMLRHGDQPELNAALIGGVRRKLNDAYAWSRSSSAVDISPIVAVSEALYSVQKIDTTVNVYSIREIIADRERAAAAAQQPQQDYIRLPDVEQPAAASDDPYAVANAAALAKGSTMRRVSIMDVPTHGSMWHRPMHRDGDPSQCPVDVAPDIGSPQPVSEGV